MIRAAILLGIIYLTQACSRTEVKYECSDFKNAIAFFSNNDVKGQITLTVTGEKINIKGDLTFPNMKVEKNIGFHIHQYGDISVCTKAGGHYNPFGKEHGAPTDRNRHVGDLGNIEVKNVGGVYKASVDITDSLVKLNGLQSVIGRAMVVHEGTDDLGKGGNEESKKTGNAGARLACAVIGVAESSD